MDKLKRALVTGGSEGIGHTFAKALAAKGYQITVVARSEEKLKNLIKDISGEHSYITADLSTDEGQGKIMTELRQKHYDLLINNAGVGTAGKFMEVALERQEFMLELNCVALVKLCYAFLENSKSGDAIINVSSNLAFMPMSGLGLYSATKAFVTSFSESLWYEQKSRGVYVMGFCPGITTTNFSVNSGSKEKKTSELKFITQTTEEVVEIALKALEKRSNPTVISGFKNWALATVTRVLPRKKVVEILAKR